MGGCLTIPAEEVLRVARLAALEVKTEELTSLARELGAIVEYVGQLSRLGPVADEGQPIGPAAAPLRADRVEPIPIATCPENTAPDFRDRFFVVPRLEAMER